jgi:uncharacterized protein
MRRIQIPYIIKDLQKKMVFISGPRQVGKTFMAKEIAKGFHNPIYLNYDSIEDKVDLLVFDELHKMVGWKNYLKGLYDTKPDHQRILVTGSARLEIFDKMGDSLAGRYFLHRLMPLSPAELKQLNQAIHFDDLLNKSGFPEPFLAENRIEAQRWRQQYTNSVLATDVFDFDNIQNLRALKTLFELLRTKVGSPISYQSLSEDVAIAPNTVKKYLEILEALYIIFRITPYSKNIARSLLKEPKIYFFDPGLVKGDEGIKLENFTAICLLKHIYGKIDYLAENYALHYLRTKDGQEVDFVLVKENSIEQLIEVKTANHEISKSLFYFVNRYSMPAIQIVKNLRQQRIIDNIQVQHAEDFLASLFL